MSYAAILAYSEGDAASDARIRLSAGLADRFSATLIGLAAGAPHPPVMADGMLVGREIEAEVKDIASELAQKEKKFLAIAANSSRSVEWRSSNELPNDALADEARSADLIVIGRDATSQDPFRSLDPGSVLLKVGRPVLAVPPAVTSLSARKILVAWHDSREARRAVRDAIPFLKLADEILLTEVSEQGAADDAKSSVHDVAKYLSRHRIRVSAGVMLKSSGSVGDELIRIAEYEKADLIVSGAYGHSRLGEWVFGGVTRDLLNRSPVCCLFSH